MVFIFSKKKNINTIIKTKNSNCKVKLLNLNLFINKSYTESRINGIIERRNTFLNIIFCNKKLKNNANAEYSKTA